MGTFSIQGGVKLKGDVTPQGAKNEALQVLCAPLLTAEKSIVTLGRTLLTVVVVV